MLPLHEKAVMINNQLPDDPTDKQVVEFPEGQVVGGATVISVYLKDKLVGSLSSLYPIVNVTRKYSADRLASNTLIKEGDVLRIVGRQYSFNTVIFVQYFGWIGCKPAGEPQVTSDKLYRVIAAIPVGPDDSPDCYLYERVCLDALEEKK